MFGVGLHFHLEELLAVRRVAMPGAVVQSAGRDRARRAGRRARSAGAGRPALVFGLAISVASTVVLIRVLADNNDLHTPAGHIAVGWLVVEDLFTVVVLVLLPALFGAGSRRRRRCRWRSALAALKIGALVAFTFVRRRPASSPGCSTTWRRRARASCSR